MPNPWFQYLEGIRRRNPNMSYKRCFHYAKMTYMKQEKKIWYDEITGKQISEKKYRQIYQY